jgi:hypothetical protein
MDHLLAQAGRQPGVNRMRDMSLKKPARPAGVLLRYRTESPPAGKGLQLSGALVVVVGLLLLSLAAGHALAGAGLGGRGDDALRGSGVGDRLAGFEGEGRMRGSPAKTGSPAAVATNSTAARAATDCSAVRRMTSSRLRTAKGTT